MATTSFKCPECGGDKITSLGNNQFHCEYCGANFTKEVEPAESQNMTRCPYCGGEIMVGAQKCRHCGEWIVRPAAPVMQPQNFVQQPPASSKSKGVAALLAFFLGCFGIHKFYLGQSGQGIFYLLTTLLLGWFVFPLIVVCVLCLIDMIVYISMSDADFAKKYK